VLSLIREKHAAAGDLTARRLFQAIALASMHEASESRSTSWRITKRKLNGSDHC